MEDGFRSLYAKQPKHPQLKDPYLGMIDVFDIETLFYSRKKLLRKQRYPRCIVFLLFFFSFLFYLLSLGFTNHLRFSFLFFSFLGLDWDRVDKELNTKKGAEQVQGLAKLLEMDFAASRVAKIDLSQKLRYAYFKSYFFRLCFNSFKKREERKKAPEASDY